MMDISNNQAVYIYIYKDGGIYAIGSTVHVYKYIRFLGSKLFFVGNHAEKGGGAYLDLNAQIYIICKGVFRIKIVKCKPFL